MGIVIPTVASDLFSDKIGLLEHIVLAAQFYLGHHKALIVTMEFVHLPGVFPIGTLHQIAVFVDDAWLTQQKQVTGITDGDFRLKLIARKALGASGPFNGNVGPLVTNADAHCAAWPRAYIALTDVTDGKGLFLEVAPDEELPLNFLCHASIST